MVAGNVSDGPCVFEELYSWEGGALSGDSFKSHTVTAPANLPLPAVSHHDSESARQLKVFVFAL